jgi:hypothetical protein
VPPGKDASEEDVAAYKKALGVPESSDKYEVNFDESTDEEEAQYWKDVFFENNIPPASANKIVESFNEIVDKAMEQKNAEDKKYAEDSEAALREEWQGEEYDTNVEYYKRAARELFGENYEEARQLKDSSGRHVMDNPLFIKPLAQIGREMGEGRIGALPVSADDLQSLTDQANEFRAKANQAMAEGKHAEAKRWDAKETEILERIPDQRAE